jgi:tRNA threonylcarbamoyladenosine biosynthesis protein TsaE
LSSLPSVDVVTESADSTEDVGRRLGRLLRPGDVVILAGELGAGKTTLTRGIGDGLGVRGDVTSPTFVIARTHPPVAGGAALLHVDAYRMDGVTELDDLDLDAFSDQAVTVVEWGDGLAETLSTNRLRIELTRTVGLDPAVGADGAAASAEERRTITVTPVGDRWAGVPLETVLRDEGRAARPAPERERRR